MALGQVDDVDVVADARPVPRRVVCPVDLEHGSVPERHRLDPRHEVVEHHLVLADLSARVRADRVEISEQDDVPLGVARGKVPEDILDDQLGATVGRHGFEGVLFVQRDVRGISVDGAGGRKHEGLAAVLRHRLAELDGARHVVVVVPEGVVHGFVHVLSSRKVNDGVKLLPGEQPVHLVERTKVGLDERQILPVVPGQFDHALHGELERVVQVIDDRQLIAWIASGVG